MRILDDVRFIDITMSARPTHTVHLLWEHDQPDTVCGELWKPEPTLRGTLLQLCSICGNMSGRGRIREPNIVRGDN